MKKILIILGVITLLTSCSNKKKETKVAKFNAPYNSKIIDLYAGPLNQYGTSKEVYSVLGKNAGCKIKIIENNTNGNIFLKVRHSADNQTKDWYTYNEGDWISAQVVHCKATSTSTGGTIKILIE